MMLSFDGGSSAEVATEVLDLLKARGVRTTLFLPAPSSSGTRPS